MTSDGVQWTRRRRGGRKGRGSEGGRDGKGMNGGGGSDSKFSPQARSHTPACRARTSATAGLRTSAAVSYTHDPRPGEVGQGHTAAQSPAPKARTGKTHVGCGTCRQPRGFPPPGPTHSSVVACPARRHSRHYLHSCGGHAGRASVHHAGGPSTADAPTTARGTSRRSAGGTPSASCHCSARTRR